MVDQDAQRAPSHPRKDENEITKGQVRTRVTLSPAVPHMMATRSPAPKFAQFTFIEGLDLWETYEVRPRVPQSKPGGWGGQMDRGNVWYCV